MTKITEQFLPHLTQRDVDFVDIHLETDNQLFINPRMIEAQNTALSISMTNKIDIFWGELYRLISGNSFRLAKALLEGVGEPNETRLGYSQGKSKGNSAGKILQDEIINTLRTSTVFRYGMLNRISHTELFIKNIREDRISDIVSKIIKADLIQFTQDQCNLHNITMIPHRQENVFNSNTLSWNAPAMINLPDFNGDPIIFVPKNILRRKGEASSYISCFHSFAIRYIRQHYPNFFDGVTPSGTNGKLLAKDIKRDYPKNKNVYAQMLIDLQTDAPLVNYDSSRPELLAPLSDDTLISTIN